MKIRTSTLIFILGCLLELSLTFTPGQGIPSPRGPFAKTWDGAYARMMPFNGVRQPGTDPSTLNGKIICGYQEWFLAPADGSGASWFHF